MSTVPDSLTNGKLNPDFADWMAGAEACHTDWNTGERVFYPAEPAGYADEPCFDSPTEEEEREGAEICATMHLDSFMPRHPSFKTFMLEQARLAAIRDNDKNWEWLGNLLSEHATRAMFTRSRTPQEYDERCEAMSGASEALHAVTWIRRVAGMLESPFKSLVPELMRSADAIERFVNAAS